MYKMVFTSVHPTFPHGHYFLGLFHLLTGFFRIKVLIWGLSSLNVAVNRNFLCFSCFLLFPVQALTVSLAAVTLLSPL